MGGGGEQEPLTRGEGVIAVTSYNSPCLHTEQRLEADELDSAA